MSNNTETYFEMIKKWKASLLEFDLLYYKRFTAEQFQDLIDLFDEMPDLSERKSGGNGLTEKLIALQLGKVADNYIEFRNKLHILENEFFKTVSPPKV